MGIEISYIKNQNLKELATIIDNNNDGIINNGNETSIFLKRAEELLNNGLCTEKEYLDIEKYCPHDNYTRGGAKLTQGTLDTRHDKKAQEQYKCELNKEINEILTRKGLNKSEANIKTAIKLIKQKKKSYYKFAFMNKILLYLKRKIQKKNLLLEKILYLLQPVQLVSLAALL